MIEDSINTTRNRINNPYALLRFQLQLCSDLTHIQEELRELNKKKNSILALVNGNPDLLSQDQKQELKIYDNNHVFNKIKQNAFKDVMDGLVWRLTKFNRAHISSFSEPDGTSGHLHVDQPSFSKELEALIGVYNNDEGIPILSDLTNCLRFGDITIFLKNGEYDIKEVKTGTPRSKARIRAERQADKLQELISFVHEGIREKENETRIIELCDFPVNHYLNEVAELIEELGPTKPFIIKELDSHLLIDLYDPYHMTDQVAEEFKIKYSEMNTKWKGSITLKFDNLKRLPRFFKASAPLSIFPFQPKICSKILTGQIYVGITLNFTELKKKFNNNGWEVLNSFFEDPEKILNLPRDQQKKLPIFMLKKRAFTTSIPHIFLTRLTYEFMKPETIIKMAEASYERGPTVHDNDTEILPHFSQEVSIWQ